MRLLVRVDRNIISIIHNVAKVTIENDDPEYTTLRIYKKREYWHGETIFAEKNVSVISEGVHV